MEADHCDQGCVSRPSVVTAAVLSLDVVISLQIQSSREWREQMELFVV